VISAAVKALAVAVDPVWTLAVQVFVDLLLKLGVKMNLVRHGSFLNEVQIKQGLVLPIRISSAVMLPLLRVGGIFDCYPGG
jgi:hypothetical protein